MDEGEVDAMLEAIFQQSQMMGEMQPSTQHGGSVASHEVPGEGTGPG